jgi:hypothetical protein
MSAQPRNEQQQKLHRDYMRWYMRQKRAADPQVASDYERGRLLRRSFLSKERSSARARAVVQSERCINGETFIGTAEAARFVGLSCNRLRVIARTYPGNNRIITLPNGWRFIRLPRHEGDQKSPLYWQVG